jgi:uncharacterized protein YcfJ
MYSQISRRPPRGFRTLNLKKEYIMATRDEDRADRMDNKAHPDRNPDPITGAPGSHPVGTGMGAAGAGAAGAAIGAVAGPVGAAVGAVVGAVAGGLAGKGVAEAVNPTAEDAYWRDNYKTRPYVDQATTYDEYAPAYRYGWESRTKYQGRKFDEVETDLQRDWDRSRGKSNLSWDRARQATRDAWDRVERAIPGDSDRDGK